MVSVLFVDLVSYTALSEARTPEDVRELLGRYFDTARTVVDRYGGAIEKFIGDAVMAVWGVPVAREDDAERAVRAALEMVEAVSAFGDEVGAAGLRARAGVVTGQVASLVNPGEGLVVGDRVNTAARVQSTAQPGTVFVDEVTRQVTSAAVAYEDAGQHAVKGKRDRLRLWRAVRVVAGRGGTLREEGLEAPFVGRDGDLRLLKELFHGAVERGAARLVAVSGAAGVGKTRLRREFDNYVDGLAHSFLWHSGRCLSYGEGVAYWALAEMVRQRLGIAEDLAVPEVEMRLAAGLDRWVVDSRERAFLTPRLGALLGIAEPGLGREELFAGWRLFFERLAEHEPVVMVFEDLQWADEGLLDFIEHLLEWSATQRIFILTLARHDLAERRAAWPAGRRGATLLQLEPLDDGAIGELLDRLVDGLPTRTRARIAAHAEGIPLYAIEMIRALADRGVLAASGPEGRLVLTGEVGELDVPVSLSSLLLARLDALDPPERELVKSTAIFSGDCPRAAIAALSEVPDDQLDELLGRLVRKQILTIRADPLSPDVGQYAFAQGLLRTVAYEMLSRRERKRLHRAAAEHLRAAFPSDGEDVAEAIAAHYLGAYRAALDDPDAAELRAGAVSALHRAAQRAATVGAPEVAEKAYRTAIELADNELEQADLTSAAGEMALQAGRSDAALDLFAAAAEAHLAGGRHRIAAHVAGRAGHTLIRAGRLEDAIEQIRSALRTLGAEVLDADVAALNAALSRALASSGQYEQAGPPLELALRTAQALALPAVFSDALTTKGVIYLEKSRAEEARVFLDGAVAVAERHDLTEAMIRALLNSGNLDLQWDLPHAAEHFQAALALARRRGDRDDESYAAAGLMHVHILAGRWEATDRLAADLLDDPGQHRPAADLVHYFLAILHSLRGEIEDAKRCLGVIAPWEFADDAERRATHAATAVVVHLSEGQAEQALSQGRRMLGDAITTLGASNEAVRHAWPDTLDAALRLDRLDQAAELIALLDHLPPGHIPPYLRAQLARGRALLNAATGNHGSVEAGLGEAIATLSSLGYPYWHARAQTDLVAWLIDQHRVSEATAQLEQAAVVLESLAAAPALDRVRELLAGLPATLRT